MSRTAYYDSEGNETFNTAYPQVTEETTWFINDNQEAKADAGKPNLTLVPTQIVRDIAEVREYGNRKYGSRDNWKNVELALYEWLLSQYANTGDKILDTHAGSGSSLIACHRMGFEITAFEIDKEYYQKAKARLEEEKAQIKFNL